MPSASERPRALVVANWKMHGALERARAYALALAGEHRAAPCEADIVVCPPATLLAAMGQTLTDAGIALGGQDCHPMPEGAHTGDISAPLLADAGCAYAICGHSERRAAHGEKDETVARKAAAAHAAGLVAIVCVGESAAERAAGHALEAVGRQVAASTPDGATACNTAIAYEPLWAIGTGRTPAAGEIEAAHRQVRDSWDLRFSGSGDGLRVLYGGSVKAANAGTIAAVPGVDGLLVGGASLSAEEFAAICRACAGTG